MYVSKLVRLKFKKRKEGNNFDDQAEVYKNFWQYCEKVLEPEAAMSNPIYPKQIVHTTLEAP